MIRHKFDSISTKIKITKTCNRLTGTSSPPSSTSTLSGRRRWQERGRSVYCVSGGKHWRLSPAGTRSVPDAPNAPEYSIWRGVRGIRRKSELWHQLVILARCTTFELTILMGGQIGVKNYDTRWKERAVQLLILLHLCTFTLSDVFRASTHTMVLP